MQQDDEKIPPLKRIRQRFDKQRKLYLGLFLCLLVLTVALNLPNLKLLRFFGAGAYLSKIQEGPLPASNQIIRRPITEGSKGYDTRSAIYHPENPSQRFTIREGKGGRVEVGVLRFGTGPSLPEEYIFKVYEVKQGERRELCNIQKTFEKNAWAIFCPNVILDGRDDGTAEIEYALEPSDLRGRLASLIARAKAEPPYYKDFAFMFPNVIHNRKPATPNIILVSIDTLRADHLGYSGYSRATSPNIDTFAENSIRFTQAISTCPWTLPAHFSLLTGFYPSSVLTDDNNYIYSDRSFAGILRDQGYYTIAFTGNGAISSIRGFSRGFNRYIEFGRMLEDSTQQIVDHAMEWLDANHNIQFFMFLHHYECHDPYRGSYFTERENADGFIEKRKALYDGNIRSADSFFGQLMEKLESLDLMSNTAIVVVSDHGEDFFDHFTEDDLIPPKTNAVPEVSDKVDHGHSLYDELVRIPMIFHLPGLKPKRTIFNNQVRIIDVMPTILDYLDIKAGDHIQGTSLMQLIEHGNRPYDPPAISEYTLSGPEQKSVRMNGYKYIYTENPNQRKWDVTYRGISRYSLFDLEKDPEEKNNIYAENKDLAEEMHAVLEETMKESDEIRTNLLEKKPPANEKSIEEQEDVINSLKALGYL